MTKRVGFLLLLLSLAVGVVRAVQLRQLSTHNGLPTSMIHCVAQDETGFLWLGTYTGLYRYDGYQSLPFKNDASHPQLMPGGEVIALLADQKGSLWIGTQEGLCRMTLATGEVKRYPLYGVSKQRINSLCLTSDGRLYAGTIRGLAVLDAGADTMKVFTSQNATGDVPLPRLTNVQDVIELPSGDLLLGTWGRGIYRYIPQQNRFCHYGPAAVPGGSLSGLPAAAVVPAQSSVAFPDTVYSLCCDGGNRLWIGSSSGICQATADRQGDIHELHLLRHSGEAFALSWNRLDSTLLAGTRHGLLAYRSGVPFAAKSLLPVDCYVRSIFSDREGLLWVATAGCGLFVETRPTTVFSAVGNQTTTALCVDRDGHLWTSHYMTTLVDNQTVTNQKRVMNISRSSQANCVLLSVWNEGFYTASAGRLLRLYSPSNSKAMMQASVSEVLEDRHGNWWVATDGGLGVRYADGREVCLAATDGVSPLLRQSIDDLAEDKDGTLWMVAKNRGLLHLLGDPSRPASIRCKEYNVANGLMPVDAAFCLRLTGDGTLWVGTDGAGLCRLDREHDRFVSLRDQWHLPGDMVTALEEDDYGCLWVGTNAGLACLHAGSADEQQLRVYTTADGLPDNYFMPRASDSYAGRLYFGTTQGTAVFTPQPPRQPPSVSKHQVGIVRMRIDGNPMPCPPSGALDRVTIPGSASNFVLYFASLTYGAQQHYAYSYRLKGIDSQWQDASDSRSAHYTHLPAGRYTFEVRATDGYGRWSEVRTVGITVEPPLWRTWWAYLIYILLAAAFAYLLYREIRSRMMTRNRLQMSVDDEGAAQVTLQHIESADAHGAAATSEAQLAEKTQLAFEIKDLNFTNADEEFLRRAIDCVNRNMGDSDFGPGQLCEQMAVSRTSLFTKLKTLTGMNASAFISDIRLKAACRIMDSRGGSSIRISDLAYQVGFNDPKYFSLSFRKKFGMTPTDYLERKG